MKKIIFLAVVCSFVIGGIAPVQAAHSCGPVTITYSGNQKPDHDEFLYADEQQYNLSVNGYNNTRKQNSGSGQAYECDRYHTASCTTDDVVTMPAGHYFKGKKINTSKTYKCYTIDSAGWDQTSFNDVWKEVGTPEKTCSARGYSWNVGTSLSVGGQNYFPSEWCSGFDRTEQDFKLVKSWEVKCLKENTFKCFAHECVKGYSVDNNGKCVKDGSDDQCTFPDGKKYNVGQSIEYDCSRAPNENKFEQNSKTGKTCYVSCMQRKGNNNIVNYWSVETCPENYQGVQFDSADQIYTTTIPGYKRCIKSQQKSFCDDLQKKGATEERLACCRAGNDTEWVDANGGNSKNSTGKPGEYCKCISKGLVWKYDSASKDGVCEPLEEPVQPVIQPEEEDCWYTFYGEFNCGNGVRVKKNSRIKLSNDDLKGMTCTKFQEIYGNDVRGIEDLFRTICLKSQYTEQISLDAATKNAISKINSLSGDVTVWRNEEGKFNTARLASDATAGVVLGTIGGVVSAKVIKKKQLEKGFDVLHCTVGGQKMADYGDTFRVSYQR